MPSWSARCPKTGSGTSLERSRTSLGGPSPTAKYRSLVEADVYLDVDCPKCFARTTHDVPARQAGRTDYPVECPECKAKFELWLDPMWFMMP